MKNIVIGIFGMVRDFKGYAQRRWSLWRPTVDICRHPEFKIERYELLVDKEFKDIANLTIRDIKVVSPETEVNVIDFSPNNAWDFQEVYTILHDFALKYKFDPESENYYINMATGSHVAQICMFLLTESRFFPAQLLEVSPPARQNSGDVGKYDLIDLDLSKYDLIAERFSRERKEGQSFLKSGIETKNIAFNSLIEQIERVALNSKAPILLTGDTGVGKTKLAGRIYKLKLQQRQVAGKFVEVNCATLRGENAMSTLFGHEKGAFTGADRKREGLLKTADKGVLFLDEIADLGQDEQAMLLRAIEEKKFYPLGSDSEIVSEFQLIAGTNKDLRKSVESGAFRDDLFARINVWTFRLPSLAERREDIEPNIDYEIEKYAGDNNLLARFNKEARRLFMDFALSDEAIWANNFRDLNASISRMATLSKGGRITTENVLEEISRLKYLWKNDGHYSKSILADYLGQEVVDALDYFDSRQLEEVIKVCRASKSLSVAGRKLFSISREKKKTGNDADRLRKYLAKYNLSWNDFSAGL